MPAYNAAPYIQAAIASVIHQTYPNWELLIINDGSTDNTEELIKSITDERIKYFHQENGGVSSARNIGLGEMKGDYFCFLDADDELTLESLELRLNVFKSDDTLNFVDGAVNTINKQSNQNHISYTPSFTGNPQKKLAMLSDECFFGITWMIKRDPNTVYQFRKGITHAEDIIFYLDICDATSKYAYTTQAIYIRNEYTNSAMSNLKALEKGYINFYNYVQRSEILNQNELGLLKRKIKSVMIKSYLSKLKFIQALQTLVRKF